MLVEAVPTEPAPCAHLDAVAGDPPPLRTDGCESCLAIGQGWVQLRQCLDCGRVEEFYDPEIEKRQNAVAEERGFVIQDHALYLYAQCAKTDCPHRNAPGRKT